MTGVGRLTLATRVLFVVFALVLVTLTHWPNLELDIDVVERPDLIAHVGAFGLWTLLLIAASFFGPMLSTRNIARAGVVGAIYAPIDELTQGLPGVHRHVSALDLIANLVGVAGAVVFMLVVARIRQRGAARRVDETAS